MATNAGVPLKPPIVSAMRSERVRLLANSSSILRTASIFCRIALQVLSALRMSGQFGMAETVHFGLHRRGLVAGTLVGKRTVALREDVSKFSTHEENLRRVVDPDDKHNQRPRGAIC